MKSSGRVLGCTTIRWEQLELFGDAAKFAKMPLNDKGETLAMLALCSKYASVIHEQIP